MEKEHGVVDNHIISYASKLKDGQKLSLSSVQTYLRGKSIKITLKALRERCSNLKIKL